MKKRVLLITSRPREDKDIPYRFVSLPVIRILETLRGERGIDIKVGITRPGTWKAVQKHLELRGPGYFNLVHFDVHGCVEHGR